MSLKRAPGDAIEEARSVQRPRLHRQDGDIKTTPESLDDINDHCILEIFKCLSVEEDLNSIAVFISSRYRALRNHDSLNQTRTGTIVCTENTTLESIRRAFLTQEWNQIFTGNRTHLKVVGLERMPTRVPREPGTLLDELQYWLPNVTSLDMSFDQLADNRIVADYKSVSNFSRMLPNLEEIDLSYMNVEPSDGLMFIGASLVACIRVQKFIWNGSQRAFCLDFVNCCSITELSLDDSLLVSLHRASDTQREYSDGTGYMFNGLANIACLSIKNVTFCEIDEGRGDFSPPFPVTQEMLIKMVRHHPALRWLRSDLSGENIAMLKIERPEITFVRD